MEDFFDAESLLSFQATRSSLDSTSVGYNPHEPNSHSGLEQDELEREEARYSTPSLSTAEIWPYPNKSSFLLGDWYWGGSARKSNKEFHKLLDIICDESFSADDIRNVPWKNINKKLGQSNSSTSLALPKADVSSLPRFEDAGWTQDLIKISVPFHPRTGVTGPREFTLGTFHHRNIIDILKDKVAGPDFKHFHVHPYRLLWKKPTHDTSVPNNSRPDPPQQVYGELYHSLAFEKAHEEIQLAPSDPPDCKLPRVVAALMFGSDETHLTQFGDTKLWPLYLYFGNESKYRRCQTSLNLCEHLAYLIKVRRLFTPVMVYLYSDAKISHFLVIRSL
jgi:hypothetical protein